MKVLLIKVLLESSESLEVQLQQSVTVSGRCLAIPVKHEKLHAAVKLSAESSVNEVKEKDTNWRK